MARRIYLHCRDAKWNAMVCRIIEATRPLICAAPDERDGRKSANATSGGIRELIAA
jgi:hypothetical protein